MQLTEKQINKFISYICIDDIIAYIEKHPKEYEDFAKKKGINSDENK